MSRVRPGSPVRGSKTGRPVMAVLDILGQRWVLRVLWELRSSASTFRDLQSRCGGISSSVLAKRLAELREMGVVHVVPQGGYSLTDEGHRLLDVLLPLDDWANRWDRRQRRNGSAGAEASLA